MKIPLSKLTNTQLLGVSIFLAFVLLLFVVLFSSNKNATSQSSTSINITTAVPIISPSQPETRLFPDDQAVRDAIITTALRGYQSGVIYESANVRIEYVNSVDQFQAEILNRDTAQAKNEAVTWLRNKGLSHHGVCHLPIRFYLGSEITRQESDSFNPLPEDC